MKSFRAAFFLWGNGTAIILKGKHPGAFVFPQAFHGSTGGGKQPGAVRRHGKKRVLADRRGVGPTVMG
ncbi:hypothetical protein B4135_2064 [Caldibacillus debilis]|uniref:Uncharacterized protein n=1 Tax=Caldibacillus debilis TaxID=301148 RepID=A0A150M484_9BACI|nr:hypothetical protein B4135_2064 [Caldibacillus debilis]